MILKLLVSLSNRINIIAIEKEKASRSLFFLFGLF